MSDLPIVIGPAGRIPQPPSAIRAALLASVSSLSPGYTANLPGILIEDVLSTEVNGVAACDAAITDLINSLTPLEANAWLLIQQGNLVGITQDTAINTSALVVFSGPPGWVIAEGFVVSDGTYQYRTATGGIIGAGGQSLPIQVIALLAGQWAVPAGTISQTVTSIPTAVQPTPTVTNPNAGTPGIGAQTEASYRAEVQTAYLAASQGMARYLKTLLAQVPGTQPRLVSPVQLPGKGWEIIVGGSYDPYFAAYAIFEALGAGIGTLVGSSLSIAGITQANPGVITTTLNHGYQNSQVVEATGILGMTSLNGVPLTILVIDEKTFSIGVDTTLLPAYVAGGVLTPNFRNLPVTITDYPDTYLIPIVVPPAQSVAVVATWNTNSPNFISEAAIATLATPALVDYVNSIGVGQVLNEAVLIKTFQDAVASLLPAAFLTRLIFAVSINGIGVSPIAGTYEIVGDPESFFETNDALITVFQG